MEGSCYKNTGREGLSADFALVLAIAAVVIIDKEMRGTAQGADDILRDGLSVSPLDRFQRFAVAPEIVFKEELPVLFDKGSDTWEFIYFEFLIFGRVGVVKRPLLERDISADKIFLSSSVIPSTVLAFILSFILIPILLYLAVLFGSGTASLPSLQ